MMSLGARHASASSNCGLDPKGRPVGNDSLHGDGGQTLGLIRSF